LQRDGASADGSTGIGDGAGFSRSKNLDGDSHFPAIGNRSAVDLHIGQIRGIDAAGCVIEIAIQKLAALKRSRLCDSIDGAENRVHLQLISADFVAGKATAVGSLSDKSLKLNQKRADFVEAALGGAVTEKKKKPEYFTRTTISNANVQKAGGSAS